MLEHLLKRIYVPLPNDYNGWEKTIRNQRKKLEALLVEVPSLKTRWNISFSSAWNIALKTVRAEYSKVEFPDSWQFSSDLEPMLAIAFGKKSSNKVSGVNAIREKLANFETMTWREILLDAKKQNHNVSVDDLVKEAQDRLTEIFPEQLDELTSLRLTGNQWVWGQISEGVMELIWWDSEHQICPSHKKDT